MLKTSAHAGRTSDRDGEQFGGAVDRQPAAKFETQSLGHVDLEQRAQHASVHQDEQHAGHRKGEAQRKGQDCHLRVVGKEIGGKTGQEMAAAAVVEHAAQRLGG